MQRFVIGRGLSSSMAVIFGRLDLFTLWRSSSGRPAGGRGLFSSSEGLKLAGRPMDAAFRHPLAVRCRPGVKDCRIVAVFVIDAAFYYLLLSAEGLKMQAVRWMQRFVILWR